MASLTPRMSGIWSSGYFQDEDNEMGRDDDVEQRGDDGRTALDRTIDRIGMGSYQWALVALCGFGWMADNMWMQTIAIIIPRVQRHFEIPDSYAGYVSVSMFFGMMIGAVGWGSCSDLLGRSTAFNLTLFFTSIFGLLASVASSFVWLCIALFFLGTSVGGSMPTDGTLLLEHMPKGKQYLVTALSVFFSFGAVLAAIAAIIVIPSHSCPPTGSPEPCDVNTENLGWKYLLIAVGCMTLTFFVCRIVFFRLHESPRYLVQAGRHAEALVSLQKISRFNGSDLSLGLHDVDDTVSHDPEEAPANVPKRSGQRASRPSARVLFDAEDVEEPAETEPLAPDTVDAPSSNERQYDSTGSSNVQLDGHTFETPVSERPPYPYFARSVSEPGPSSVQEGSASDDDDKPETLPPRRMNSERTRPAIRRGTNATMLSMHSRRLSFSEAKAKAYWALPRWIRRPLWAWLDRVALVLSPEYLRTTLLVWAMWGFMSLAFTMFNVFLPKLLEMRGGEQILELKSLEETMWDIVIFTLGGCPGALLGAYLVESSLGRRWSLAASTFATAGCCIIFVFAESSFAVRSSSMAISLSATTMWAVLYGWTPEIFETEVRGTACGTASALSRIGGMIAPAIGGVLLVVNRSFPVYTSAAIFGLAGGCTLLLKETAPRKPGAQTEIVH